MDQVRTAVIGFGGMGSQYVEMLYKGEVEGMTLAGVCCRNLPGQERLRREFPGTAVYKDVDDAMAHSGDFDAAVIVTPHTSHVEIGCRAAQAGKHILSDKPAGVSAGEVRRLLRRTEEAGVSYGMIFNVRTNPAYQKAREIVASGCLGKLQRAVWICNTWFRTPAYHRSAPWRSTWKGECGGLLINQCQHYLDIWQWLFGMPDRIFASLDYGKYNDFQVEDGADIQLEYEGGLHGTFISASGENPGVNRLEVGGTKGCLCVEDAARVYLDENDMDVQEFGQVNEEIYGILGHHRREIPCEAQPASPYRQVFQNFSDHLRLGTPLMAEGREGLGAVTLTNAAYLSSWLDRRIQFPIDEKLYDMLLVQRQRQEEDGR